MLDGEKVVNADGEHRHYGSCSFSWGVSETRGDICHANALSTWGAAGPSACDAKGRHDRRDRSFLANANLNVISHLFHGRMRLVDELAIEWDTN